MMVAMTYSDDNYNYCGISDGGGDDFRDGNDGRNDLCYTDDGSDDFGHDDDGCR